MISSIYSKKITLLLSEINTYHTDKVSGYIEFFIVFGYCGIEEILNAAYLPYYFADLDEFYLLRKNDVGSMENKHIPHRHVVKIYDFFIVFRQCVV